MGAASCSVYSSLALARHGPSPPFQAPTVTRGRRCRPAESPAQRFPQQLCGLLT